MITKGDALRISALNQWCLPMLLLVGTGVRELMTGLAILPRRWIQEPLVVRDRDGRPSRGPSGSALVE